MKKSHEKRMNVQHIRNSVYLKKKKKKKKPHCNCHERLQVSTLFTSCGALKSIELLIRTFLCLLRSSFVLWKSIWGRGTVNGEIFLLNGEEKFGKYRRMSMEPGQTVNDCILPSFNSRFWCSTFTYI